jgi:hypothetical protein
LTCAAIIGGMTRRTAVTVGVALLVVVGACTATPGESASSPGASGTALPSPSRVAAAATASASASASASVAPELHDASQAALELFSASDSDVEMTVRREKGPDDPVETLLTGKGRVEPAMARGRVRFDFAGLFTNPDASEPPSETSVVEVVWTPDQVFARSATKPNEAWTPLSRADARASGGYIGRLPDEVVGLVTLVASSRSETFVALEDGSIDGKAAQRWRVPVPVETAVVQGVPADAPDARVLRDTYGVNTIDVEVWLVDGTLRRVGYQVAREKSVSGGPDRTTVTYDWSAASSTDSIVVPPSP